jgi:predicted dehydrogenase
MLDATQSGGAILDLHVHDVDFAHYFLGIPDTISACGTQGPSNGIDHVVATYGYADGRYAVLEGGWAFTAPWPFDMAIAVHGSRGSLEWIMTRGNDVLLYTGGPKPEAIPSEGDVLEKELSYFIDCILANRPVERCSPASTRLSVVLAWLERRSIESGRVVQVAERLHDAWEE